MGAMIMFQLFYSTLTMSQYTLFFLYLEPYYFLYFIVTWKEILNTIIVLCLKDLPSWKDLWVNSNLL